MQALDFNEKLRNLVIVGLVIAVTLVSAVHENYLVIEKGWAPAFHSMFWFVLLGGFCLLVWLAWSISTRRLVSFVAVIFIIEYINQSLATKLGLWTYSAQGGAYIFGVWAWVVSGLVTYAIASRATVRLTMKGKLSLPRFLNPVVVIVLFLVICFFGRDHLIEAGRQMLQSFLIFYGALMVVGILASLWMDTRALVGVIISALIVGFISESAGATAGIWQFLQPPTPDQGSALTQSSQAIRISASCPPVYLILGCWPLEILAQFALSALISGEAVVTLPPSQEPPQGASSGNGKLDDGFHGVDGEKEAASSKQREDNCAEPEKSHGRGDSQQTSASIPPERSPVEKEDLPEELTDGEKVLRVFMRISALVYFLVGLMFAIWPGMITQIGTDPGVFIRSPTGFPRVLERFWVSMSFSMMMTISFLAFYAQYDIRKNKHFVIPLLIAKASSAISALAFFVFVWPYRLHIAIFLVDGTIFWLTLHFYLQANMAFLQAQTAYFRDRLAIHAPSTEETTVAVFKGEDKFALLDKVLVEACFYRTLEGRFQQVLKEEEARGNTQYSRKDFSVVIKPNFMFAHAKLDPSTYTDPELVEHLVERIREKGFINIAVVEAQSTLGNYYDNRTVQNMASYLGYTATNYRIVDLTLEKEPHDYGGTLGRHFIGPTWRDADFRVSFAKNKTHIFSGYTLTLKNIYGTFPTQDKLKAYHTKREFDWPTIETLKPGNFPVHFGLIDAFISADGQLGVICDPEPNPTKTIIGGNNLVAVDQVGGMKMGLDPEDPSTDRCFYLAVKTLGRPNVKWIGDKSTYEPWENVSQIFIRSLDLIEEAYRFSDWWFSILSAQAEIFPFKRKTPTVLFLRWLLRPLKRIYFKYDAL
jgi:uncharacterized protein (DUF362 family)